MTIPQVNPVKQNIIKYLDAICRETGGSIGDPATHQSLLDVMSTALSEASVNPIALHGFRAESMFAYVARAMGHCLAVKEEDSGQFYSPNPELRPPDFRVVTNDSYEFLVEVKNSNKTDLDEPFKFRPRYFEALQAYAELFKKDLKIAIYWRKPRLWSLVSANRFTLDAAGRYSLSMKECFKRSEMHLIGDSMIGTEPPLALRLLPDLTQAITMGADGQVAFTIGDVEFWCAGTRVDGQFEQQLVWFLMLYGPWETDAPQAELSDGGELISVWIEALAERADGENFAFLGYLSHMISNQYNLLTAPEGEVRRLTPLLPPDELGIIIPADYKGHAVRLWRFIQKPNLGP